MNDKSESLLDLLLRLDACGDARTWAVTQPDLRTAWAVCQRADWMLWLAAMLLPRPVVVLAACDCAETAVHLIEDGGLQMNALLALHIAREWAQGREDPETVRAASDAAYYFFADHASNRAAAYAANIVHDYAMYYAADADYYDAADANIAADAAADAAIYAAAAAASYAAATAANADYYAATADSAAAAASYAAAASCDRQSALAYMADLVRARISADMICEVQNER